MKKLLALLLVLSVLVTVLCSCKKNAANNGGENGSETTAEETTIDITTLGNYYQDLSEPVVVEGAVTHKIYQAWWEEDVLVIQLYIINGMSDPISDLFIENLYVFTEEGQIAQSALGPLGMDPIPAGEYVLETFYLGYGVDLPNTEISTLSIDCVIDFIY